MDPSAELRAILGSIDVYLFDQLLRGRFDGRESVLDVGCGGGRNLEYLLRAGLRVYAVDRDPEAIADVTALAARLAPGLPSAHFAVADARRLPHEDGSFDAVVCNALLHFARDEEEFRAWLDECGRVLAPGGLFFARLCSDIGIEDRVRPPGDCGRGVRRSGLANHAAERPLISPLAVLERGRLPC